MKGGGDRLLPLMACAVRVTVRPEPLNAKSRA